MAIKYITRRAEDKKWCVKNAKAEKATRVFETQKEAIEYAESLKTTTSIMIQSKEGKFRKVSSWDGAAKLVKKPTAKKATAKKPVAKKAPIKKTTTKKPAAQKAPVKKPAAKKAPAKKATVAKKVEKNNSTEKETTKLKSRQKFLLIIELLLLFGIIAVAVILTLDWLEIIDFIDVIKVKK